MPAARAGVLRRALWAHEVPHRLPPLPLLFREPEMHSAPILRKMASFRRLRHACLPLDHRNTRFVQIKVPERICKEIIARNYPENTARDSLA